MNTNSRTLGKYELQTLLGSGGMGEVWKAFDAQLQRYVAIKMLQANLRSDPNFVKHFQREAQLIASLHHPNIVQLFDFHIMDSEQTENCTCYMVMDYVDGQTLAHFISATSCRGQFPPFHAIAHLFAPLSMAIDYAHQKGMLHRDIKPANILLDSRLHHYSSSYRFIGEPILSDFGIAKLMGTSTNTLSGCWAGTPHYTSPEQARGYPGDERSDLYALGAVLYEMFTGRQLFQGDNATAVLMQHIQAMPTAPSLVNPNISPAVNMVILKSVSKDPADRFQSAQQLTMALFQALQLPLPQDLSYDAPELYSQAQSAQGQILSSPGTASGPSSSHSVASNPFLLSPQVRHPVKSADLFALTPTLHIVPSLHQKKTRRRSRLMMSLGSLLLLCVVVLALGIKVPSVQHPGNPTNTALNLPDGIGVAKAKNGEYVGVSDGTFAFDTKRLDGQYKILAAERLKAKDFNSAYSLWQDALALEGNDAEVAIYLEDQRVLDSGDPYVTIVAGNSLTGSANNLATGHECMQAAYIAQKEYNDAAKLPRNYKVRVLIANYGSDATTVVPVAQQVLRLARTDKTIVGAMSWTFNAISVFSPAKMPMVSGFGADVATNISHYFFRVVQPSSVQGRISAVYAEQTLHARTAVVFVDNKNNFSRGLATGFTDAFTAQGYNVLAQELYTTGKTQNMPALLTDALSKKPDIIFFSGGPGDASPILAHLKPSDPPIMGGSSLYQLGGYTPAARQGLYHLHFTAFSYPDEWEIEGLSAQKPPFFTDYQKAFDPANQHISSPYSFRRADGTTMEQYDAMALILYGVGIALTEQQQPTPGGLQHALTEVVGNRAYQGVTGQISLGPDGNPVDRAVVGICVTRDKYFKMDGMYGRFLKGGVFQTQFLSQSVCS